ncbi:MAG TPA: OmpA family protein, partial [Candidatus Methylomirabilis sp.]|nr:OmpA family protein [Candidatus Methylomirabilis sp.]
MQERSSVRILFTVGVLVGSLALMGCPKRPEVAQAGPGAVGPGAAAPGPSAPSARPGETPVTRPAPPRETPVRPSPGAPATAVPGVPAGSPLKDVFFDFDKANIRDDQKGPLNENVSWLKSNTRAKITIEGHCDERGTVEYNLGLGERRAKAVKDYLVAAGIGA